MRYLFVTMILMLSPMAPTGAQVSIQIGLPGVNIGINQPAYPQLVAVPGYPVYYDPGASSNYFFYDGMYWVFQGDNWYASSWFNGPWALVAPMYVPVFVLRVPVSYYRYPPAYFHGWQRNGPPRWGERWGNDWERQHSGWDRWDRGSAPHPAPLPVYQRQYSGNRYPQAEQQREIHEQNYRYRPNDAAVKRVEQAHAESRPAPQAKQEQPQQQKAQQQQQQQQQRAQQDQQARGKQQEQPQQQKAQQQQQQQQQQRAQQDQQARGKQQEQAQQQKAQQQQQQQAQQQHPQQQQQAQQQKQQAPQQQKQQAPQQQQQAQPQKQQAQQAQPARPPQQERAQDHEK
jgi:hypothetical protein